MPRRRYPPPPALPGYWPVMTRARLEAARRFAPCPRHGSSSLDADREDAARLDALDAGARLSLDLGGGQRCFRLAPDGRSVNPVFVWRLLAEERLIPDRGALFPDAAQTFRRVVSRQFDRRPPS